MTRIIQIIPFSLPESLVKYVHEIEKGIVMTNNEIEQDKIKKAFSWKNLILPHEIGKE
jgi:hypothetical protein